MLAYFEGTADGQGSHREQAEQLAESGRLWAMDHWRRGALDRAGFADSRRGHGPPLNATASLIRAGSVHVPRRTGASGLAPIALIGQEYGRLVHQDTDVEINFDDSS